MKILVSGMSSQRGGVESFLISYCSEIMSQRPDVVFDFVVYNSIPRFALCMEERGCGFVVIPDRVSHPFQNYRKSKEAFELGDYDRLWLNVCTLSDITLARIASKYRVGVVVHAHNSKNMGNVINGLLHDAHRREIGRYSQFCLACSDSSGRFMYPHKIISSDRYAVVKNGIESSKFAYSEEKRKAIRDLYGLEGKYVVGHVGRFHPQKNHDFLLRIFAEYKKMDHDAILMLVGDGELRERIEEESISLGIADDVLLVGVVEDTSAYYSAMDCFVLPSVYEGFVLAALEAQDSGLPCLISDNSPSDLLVLSSSKRLPLSDSPLDWAKQIGVLKTGKKNDRCSGLDAVNRAGLTVQSSSAIVMDIFDRADVPSRQLG